MIDVGALATDAGFEPAQVTWSIYPAAVVDSRFGESSPGTPVQVVETITVHPTGRRTLERLPKLDQRRETISLYTNRTDIAVEGTPSRVVYEGRTYEAAAMGNYNRIGDIRLVHAQLADA